jgi:hypothetical protein
MLRLVKVAWFATQNWNLVAYCCILYVSEFYPYAFSCNRSFLHLFQFFINLLFIYYIYYLYIYINLLFINIFL